MPEVTRDIAQRVLDADIRNLVKKVGEGGTLSNADRQIFLELTEGSATADQIREARISALLRKWMDGGRLSGAERDEISHILPDAFAVNTEAVPLPQRADALTMEEAMEFYDISRAKYFRWKQAGQAVPEGPDLPPFEDPKSMVAWYERMVGRGIFKHQCPRLLKELALNGLPTKSTNAAKAVDKPKVEASQAAPTSTSNTSTSQRQAPEERGFLVEFEKLEAHTATLRHDYLAAYEQGEESKGALLKTRYFESLELLRKMASQKESIGLAEKSLVKKSDVVDLQGPIVRSILKNLIASHMLRGMYDELGLEKIGVAFDAFVARQAKHARECFAELIRSDLAEPLSLES